MVDQKFMDLGKEVTDLRQMVEQLKEHATQQNAQIQYLISMVEKQQQQESPSMNHQNSFSRGQQQQRQQQQRQQHHQQQQQHQPVLPQKIRRTHVLGKYFTVTGHHS